ncbi:MAG: hypothetical protein K0S93_71 [Nitrososphaeraceae archaeon]|jgi:hypothetical protein|nr:hypothetical protein [Nitrososphaeraceae archaeon]
MNKGNNTADGLSQLAEISNISLSISSTIKNVRQLQIDNKLKQKLLTDLFISYFNVQRMGELI